VSRSGDYGVDAPLVPIIFGVAAVAALGIGIAGAAGGSWFWAVFGLANAAWFGFSAGTFLYTTRVGKHVVWASLLDELKLRGDERVLDVGCGRGAVLLLAAQRLPNGRAVGIDLWSTTDQSGNAEATTLRNAELEGVRERVELHTGDMREMPFRDGEFDAIVSSLAIHNIKDADGRKRALDEILRVLKPGGTALLADFRFTGDYAAHLAAGAETSTRNLGWRFWYGGPHAATRLVTMRKR
jgi:SAM-dependent methyltransferase